MTNRGWNRPAAEVLPAGTRSKGGRWSGGPGAVLARLCESAWFSYSTIFLLQLQVIWGIWNAPSLGSGDTSSYFHMAQRLAELNLFVSPVMSPLYVAFYAIFVAAFGDPYTATWLHRVVIVLMATLAALGLFRQLLPPAIAWGLAAWWSLSPIIFNTLYEVHLFSAIPVLTACIVAAVSDSPWGRGSALAILAMSGLLVRSELTAAAVVFAVGCGLWEWFSRKRGNKATSYFLAYSVPLAFACAVVLLVHLRVLPGFEYRLVMDHRHRLNMAQVFAFGYQQRHPEWRGDPWSGFRELLVQHFGVAEPSIGEMLQTNPRATLEHFLWNIRLTPAGLQLLLFSAVSGDLNPDYPVPPTNSRRALVLSILLGSIWIIGGFNLVRRWDQWWRDWIQPRAPAWIALLAVSSVAPLIIVSQRPRPSYLFGLAAMLMAFTGLCVLTILDSKRRRMGIAPLWPVAALSVVVVAPHLFRDQPPGKPILFMHVERLRSYHSLLIGKGERLYHGYWRGPVENYVCDTTCVAADVPPFEPGSEDLPTYLDSNGFTALYVDEPLLQKLEARQDGSPRPFVDFVPSPWRVLHVKDGIDGRWRLYHRGKWTTNLSDGKAATQSSTEHSGVASRAVDGNTNGSWGNGSVTHTGEGAGEWWEVDLGSQQEIERIDIWNRTDCCGSQLTSYFVLVSNAPNPQPGDPGIFQHLENAEAGTPTSVTVGTSGRYVRIQQRGTDVLSLAEVQVWQ